MVMWIILAYLAASCVASVVVYAACVAAVRADKIQQHAFTANLAHEMDDQRTERIATARLALTI